MKILLTNDDGIDAHGLKVCRDIARQFTDDADIWVVAPHSNKSGVGHCVSYQTPMQFEKKGKREIALHGYPADCVLAGIYHFMGEKPDLILSGINAGNNSGQNSIYSGTVGAAIEGSLQGVKSLALSQYFGPKTKELNDKFNATREYAPQIIEKLLSKDWSLSAYARFYNINFPPCSADEVRGVRMTYQSFRTSPFSLKASIAPNQQNYLHIMGGAQHENPLDEGDVDMNLKDYVSITPMTADLTDGEGIDTLSLQNALNY